MSCFTRIIVDCRRKGWEEIKGIKFFLDIYFV